MRKTSIVGTNRNGRVKVCPWQGKETENWFVLIQAALGVREVHDCEELNPLKFEGHGVDYYGDMH